MPTLEKQYLRLKRRLSEKIKSKKNVKKILEFDNYKKNLRLATKRNYLESLLWFGKQVNKPFEKMTEQDITEIFDKLEGVSIRTVMTRRAHVRIFFKWLYQEENPEPVKNLEVRRIKNSLKPSDLVTEQEVLRMLEVTPNCRDKCIIMMLYEGALRVGELLNMRLKDINFTKHGVKVWAEGKTGGRFVPLVKATPFIRDWLNQHPNKNPESKLIVNLGSWRDKPAFRWMIERLVKVTSKRAKLNKRVYPHLLRHSRLTECATFMTTAELNAFSGWSQSSRQAETYVHLSASDIEKKILEHEGIIDKEETESVLKPKICPFCSTENPVTNSICNNCFKPLDMRTAIEHENKEKKRMAKTITELVLENLGREKLTELPEPIKYPTKQGTIKLSESGTSLTLDKEEQFYAL